ncbi:hypothetical protein FJ930_10960 [Mesorhizobium sp. B2-4-15]|uniref:hypothetical protein n=1 Tax=Mesorhizobium sp. B2-4-15 TaxID=2589934 RepID=UPI001153FACB|nr:hypothetical protein [Mesorhizobium sp. B2-4-15]TPK73012.1 hypothetical protein FJ930_10960 [Mesorhizobium sp. B2-4-15]
MAFAIKAKIANPGATTFAFTAQRTMYGGKHVAKGDAIFLSDFIVALGWAPELSVALSRCLAGTWWLTAGFSETES